MKRNIAIALSICLLSLGLASCGDKTEKVDMLSKTVEDLASGVKISGRIDETAKFLNGRGGSVTGETAQTRYDFEYVFENRDTNGFERKLYGFEGDGTRYNLVNEVLIEGQDGLAYYNELGYENKIVDVPAEASNGDDVNFGYFCDNPFRYLSRNDFTKIDNNTYNLERKKASFIASKLFSTVDVIFDEVIKTAKFYFEDSKLVSIVFEPKQIETYDTFGLDNRYFLLDAKATIQVSDIGTATITRQSVRPHYEEHDALNVAFDEIEDNYTLDVVYNFKIDNQPDSVHYKFYYTKNGVFWDCGGDDVATTADLLIRYNNNGTIVPYGYDEANDKFTTAAASDFSSLFNAPKEVFVPVVSDVAAEVFDFNKNTNEYHVNPALQSFIGIECFIPSCVAEQYLNGYGTDCVVTLNENHLNQITVSYYRRDSFSDRSGEYILTYSNVGTTTLPYSFS